MKANPRRLELAKLSRALKPLVEAGKFQNVNAAIQAYYSQQTGKTEWRTFNGWKERGYQVVKGATGFPVWGSPRPMGESKREDSQGEPGAEMPGAEWFPLCYLFHDGQVQPIATKAAALEPAMVMA